MNKILLIIVILGLFASGYYFYNNKQNQEQFKENNPIIPSQTNSTNKAVVPLPTEEDIIRTFFNLINEKRIPEAINMMSETTTSNDSYKQQWGVTFNSWKKVTINKIEPYDFEWTDTQHIYLTEFTLEILPGKENMWENGLNTRFVTIVKENNLWKIQGLSTGP